jgi:hypothetical protein
VEDRYSTGWRFTIQYFGTRDRLLYLESVDVNELIEALDRARMIIREPGLLDPAEGNPRPIGCVILDSRGRQVARGYSRDA